MRISDRSSDVCSSDLLDIAAERIGIARLIVQRHDAARVGHLALRVEQIVDRQAQARSFQEGQIVGQLRHLVEIGEEAQIERRTVVEFRSEEHTSELQSLMRQSSAVFCLNNKKLITI